MKDLIKIELYKISKGRDKYILIVSFSLMIFLAWTSIITGIDSNSMNRSFYFNLSKFFQVNFELLLPLSIGIFTISLVCNEFSNKTIKNYLMSGYTKEKILFSKLISIYIVVSLVFLITISIFIYLSYFLSDKSAIYRNFRVASNMEISLNIIGVIGMILLYIFAVISFSLMLGYLTKKKGVSILIYIILITIILLLYSGLRKLLTVPSYTFFQTSNVPTYIGVYGFYFNKIRDTIPSISNSALFLAIALLAFHKHEY